MKRDRTAERLIHWRDRIENWKSESAPDYFSVPDFEAYCQKNKWRLLGKVTEYSDIYFQMLATHTAALGKAAEFFGLDLKDEAQKATLLTILANVVFGEAPKGAPRKHKRKWSRFRLVRLAVDMEKIKEGAPHLSDKKAAALLKKKFPKRYKHNSAEMIRQNAAAARGWLDNARRIRADRRGLVVE